MAINSSVALTLEDSVDEVLNILTGLELTYSPSQERFHSITRYLNRALRAVALEHEWSYFASSEELGRTVLGQQEIELSSRQRLRIIADDAIRLATDSNIPVRWAYFLPRDAIHKYRARKGLWAAVTRTTITLSRPITEQEVNLRIVAPVMREPRMFDIVESGQEIPLATRQQQLDFDYPDLVIAKAAHLYAQSDPLMQPRVQTLDAAYKDLMYALVERDDRFTDSPYLNEFTVPIESNLAGSSFMPAYAHLHPHADERY